MIGWWIVVSTQGPQERDQADQESRRAAILAQWEAGAEGIRWIERMTREGKAAKLSGGGYPNRYTAQARDVLPLIEGGGIQPPKDGIWIFGIDEGEEYAHQHIALFWMIGAPGTFAPVIENAKRPDAGAVMAWGVAIVAAMILFTPLLLRWPPFRRWYGWTDARCRSGSAKRSPSAI